MRGLARVALRWYYSDIEVQGVERVPRDAALVLVVNHPNALVDALLVGTIIQRRVLITAKATLFSNSVAGAILRRLGVLPLLRAADIRQAASLDPRRNQETFRAIREALRRRGVVLIFPEGKTHDDPSLAPLKTGAARIALDAYRSGEAPDLAILPIGLTFERKEAPRTRVLAQIGEPLCLGDWHPAGTNSEIDALTREIDLRLRAITLNFSTPDDAARATALAGLIASLVPELSPDGAQDRPLRVQSAIARRIDEVRSELAQASPELRTRADHLLADLLTFSAELRARGIAMDDVTISLRWRDALRFLAHQAWLLLTAGPLAAWGRVNHWLPLRLARWLGGRSVESAADPAMRTIVAGLALILIAYAAQGLAVALAFGTLTAIIYLVSLPIAADASFRLSDRFRRSTQRVRAFVLLRTNAEARTRLLATHARLRAEIMSLEHALADARDLSS